VPQSHLYSLVPQFFIWTFKSHFTTYFLEQRPISISSHRAFYKSSFSLPWDHRVLLKDCDGCRKAQNKRTLSCGGFRRSVAAGASTTCCVLAGEVEDFVPVWILCCRSRIWNGSLLVKFWVIKRLLQHLDMQTETTKHWFNTHHK